MKLRLLPILGAFLLSGPCLAAGGDINVNGESARLTVDFPLPNRNVLIDGSWLYRRGKANIFSVGGYLTGKAAGGNRPLTAGVGTRFYYMHYDAGPSQDSSNLSLGGFVQYQFPRLDRLGVGANLFYAPSVLSFGDSDDFYEVGTWVGYQIIRDAEVYLGWRRIGSDLDQGGDTVVDTGVHIGLRARF